MATQTRRDCPYLGTRCDTGASLNDSEYAAHMENRHGEVIPTPTAQYEAEREDERIRAALIIRATTLADLLQVSSESLRKVTDAIIENLGTRDTSGHCRLCTHDHDPVRSAAIEVRDAIRKSGDRGWKRSAMGVLEAALEVALSIEPHSTAACPCDLPQVGAADAAGA
jgi:hypothetical protein